MLRSTFERIIEWLNSVNSYYDENQLEVIISNCYNDYEDFCNKFVKALASNNKIKSEVLSKSTEKTLNDSMKLRARSVSPLAAAVRRRTSKNPIISRSKQSTPRLSRTAPQPRRGFECNPILTRKRLFKEADSLSNGKNQSVETSSKNSIGNKTVSSNLKNESPQSKISAVGKQSNELVLNKNRSRTSKISNEKSTPKLKLTESQASQKTIKVQNKVSDDNNLIDNSESLNDKTLNKSGTSVPTIVDGNTNEKDVEIVQKDQKSSIDKEKSITPKITKNTFFSELDLKSRVIKKRKSQGRKIFSKNTLKPDLKNVVKRLKEDLVDLMSILNKDEDVSVNLSIIRRFQAFVEYLEKSKLVVTPEESQKNDSGKISNKTIITPKSSAKNKKGSEDQKKDIVEVKTPVLIESNCITNTIQKQRNQNGDKNDVSLGDSVIIYPKVSEDANVRRSSRVRCPPLNRWIGGKLVQKEDGTYSIVAKLKRQTLDILSEQVKPVKKIQKSSECE